MAMRAAGMECQEASVEGKRAKGVSAMVRTIAAAIVCGIVWGHAADGAVYNIHLFTDNGPDYTTLESYVATALAPWSGQQEKATAVWRWSCKHRRQTSATIENGKGLWDPIMFFNSYANTFCGYIAGMGFVA